jgi:hypothetical protein
MYSYLCTKFHVNISIFGSKQYLTFFTLNSYNLTTKNNIHIPITYYDMKYLYLYVYQFSWGYLNIWIPNILEKHDEIVCIWWVTIEHTTLLWEVNTQGENPPGNINTPLSFGRWIRENMETALPHILQATNSYKTRKVSTASCNFSASWHRGPASWHQEKIWFRQWVPCTVTYSRGGHNWKCGIKNMTTLRSQMHKSWVCRRWSPAGYLSQVKSKWDQCPASSSPAHISSPDK